MGVLASGRAVVRLMACAVALMSLVAGCGLNDRAAELTGYELEPAPNLAGLSLPAVEPDGGETPFDFVAEPGELLVVFFGYASCPDVCPTTLADLRAAFDDLGDRAEFVDLAMVTIDPEVDTPQVLTPYVRSFIGSAIAVRTLDEEALREVTRTIGADYGKDTVDGKDEVFHTASVYAIDDVGEVVLVCPFGTRPAEFANDIAILQDRS